jgi:hypothetical protein
MNVLGRKVGQRNPIETVSYLLRNECFAMKVGTIIVIRG